jgi:SAM-dependent methyltransferase
MVTLSKDESIIANLQAETIRDFGDQWTKHSDNAGYYGSVELLGDILHPFLTPADICDKRVAEIGSGTGRIVNMLLKSDAAYVLAIEPSRAFDVLAANTATVGGRVELLHILGEEMPPDLNLDLIVSIGVLHHIPNPDATVRAAWNSLAPGGSFLAWLYAYEGNELYLSFVVPLRRLVRRLPASALTGISYILSFFLDAYIFGCSLFRLPQRSYIKNVIGRFDRTKRRLVIYDQLNPTYAKYYTRDEAEDLFLRCGFVDVKSHHRHGYSWTVVGSKPL